MLNVLKISKLCRRFASDKQKCQELVTLNEMPVPEGDFFAHHRRRDLKHKAVLGLGIVMFSSAIFAFNKVINLNNSPPETYERDEQQQTTHPT